MAICYTKSPYGSVHENTSVCLISDTPIQRIGLTNCEQDRHLCFAPPCNPIPCFGDLSDTTNRYKNDSLYWLFDFPSAGGDNYVLEKYNFATSTWSTTASLDNTQGVKYTFGDSIFNDKYDNRSGYRLDTHRIITLYGEGMYRFLVENTTTYADSLFSTCFCVKNWDCDLARGTVKVYTNFTGNISDWKRTEMENDHDIACMEWVDSRRYYGVFKRDIPTINDTVFIKYNRVKHPHKSDTTPNYNLGLVSINREAMVRLFTYGRLSRAIFITDYNEDIVGFSQHWTDVSMPNPYSTDEPDEINKVALATMICQERRDLTFNRCVSCDPILPNPPLPDPVPTTPINPTATMLVVIDTTSFDIDAAFKATEYARQYAADFRRRYPDWTGDLVFHDDNSERWLSWGRLYAKNNGIKDVVMVSFIDESNPTYHGIEPTVSTTPTALYITDHANHVDDYNNYFDSFKAIVYAVPTANLNIVPSGVNPNGYTIRNYYVNMQNAVQCAYHGEVILESQFIPSYQDLTNQLEIILTENDYDTLGINSGLKHYGYFEKHDFENGFDDLTYQQFYADMDVMFVP